MLDCDRHLRVEVAPQHVGVEEPGVVEAGRLGLPADGNDAILLEVAAEGDAEFHSRLRHPASGQIFTPACLNPVAFDMLRRMSSGVIASMQRALSAGPQL